MLLHLLPSGPTLAQEAASGLQYFRLCGLSVVAVSGAYMLALPKGSYLYRLAQSVFFASLLGLGAVGVTTAWLTPHIGSAILGVLALYLAATAWATTMGKEDRVGTLGRGAYWIPAGIAYVSLILGLQGAASHQGVVDGAPYPLYLGLALFSVLIAFADLDIAQRGASEHRRMVRERWRTGAALIAAVPALLTEQQPALAALSDASPIPMLPQAAIVIALIVWLVLNGGPAEPSRERGARKPVAGQLAPSR